jgi:hypothetical protein
MSLYLGQARRAAWTEMGEPDRPPLPELGEHDGRAATGPDHTYNEARDGSLAEWKLRKQAEQAEAAEAAEAQRLWEEKARAEAAAWRERHGDPLKPWYEAGEEGEAGP